jgi:16S rRNA (cytidine1402-2'-O)-methyltransferase
MLGKFYIVATPIGNLEDFSIRAIKTITNSDYIVSEDTRETQKILNYLNLDKKPQISYRDQNHYQVFKKIVEILKSGLNVSLVTDRGTPLISDPGYKLVREILNEGIEIDSIPGPSAILDSLVLSGLPTDKFIFLGFLPKKETQMAKILEKFGNLEASLIIFESPFRVLKTLKTTYEVLGNRGVAICKELTKIHQEVYRFNLAELDIQQIDLRGEFVLIISKE